MADTDPILFVSHVSEDRAAALEIVGELERRGVPCWIAPRNVQPGHPFDDEIVAALDHCRAMLLIFSEHCNESEYIRREVTVAGENRKVIIPFRIEDVQPRRGLRVRLSDLHWIDGFSARERAIDELANRFAPPAAEKDQSERQEAEQRQREEEARRKRAEEERRQRLEEQDQRRAEEERKLQQPLHTGRPFRRRPVAIGIGIAAAFLVAILGLTAAGVFKTPPNQQTSTAPSAPAPTAPTPTQPPPAVQPAPQPIPALQPAVGQSFRDCTGCPEMVVVPPGQFMMGSDKSEEGRYDDEGPRHAVTIKTAFAVGKYDVMRSEYAKFIQATGRSTNSSCLNFAQTDRDPVVCVSWHDAKAYVDWFSNTTGKGYHLLTEAEWEYAARAGTTTMRYWGDAIGSDNANCLGCGSRWDGNGTSPAGSFAANPWGLYDMLGDAWQWVEDCYHDSYVGAPVDAAAWVSGDCRTRVMRGGSWNNIPRFVRAAYRDTIVVPYSRNSFLGFRLARTVTP
jgi:formylglycine-generating enzyme required for sulfatase activity